MTKKSKAVGIKSWPEDDRPREKLLKKGARILSNSELLAILLRSGTKEENVVELANKILKRFGSNQLPNLNFENLNSSHQQKIHFADLNLVKNRSEQP